jgi:formate hydrogenlyase subunit 4
MNGTFWQVAGSLAHLAIVLACAPFLLSIINRTRALISGRVGQPWLQPYYDIWKLLHKGAVYSRTTTWVFRAGPMVGLAAILTALLLVPAGGTRALISFSGDFLLLIYLLGLARMFTVLAALDTGSAFEGMGASREVLFSALAEPALLLGLAAVGRAVVRPEQATTAVLSLSHLHAAMTLDVWSRPTGLFLLIVAVALMIVLLAETCRIPVDDPTTHLELTMIHEVMVLDHGGVDFAFILYGAALKLWIFAALLINVVLPIRTGLPWLDSTIALALMPVLAVVVGVIESTMARLKMNRVPHLLVGATALAALAFVLER